MVSPRERFFNVGDHVKKGEPIVILEHRYNLHDAAHISNLRWDLLKVKLDTQYRATEARVARERGERLVALGNMSGQELQRLKADELQAKETGADAVAREKWTPAPPKVDVERGFFFSAETLSELARRIVMKYQRVPMPSANLEATVARYNSFVDTGVDVDFGKPKPQFKIARPPFYAAWATPMVHDTRPSVTTPLPTALAA